MKCQRCERIRRGLAAQMRRYNAVFDKSSDAAFRRFVDRIERGREELRDCIKDCKDRGNKGRR